MPMAPQTLRPFTQVWANHTGTASRGDFRKHQMESTRSPFNSRRQNALGPELEVGRRAVRSVRGFHKNFFKKGVPNSSSKMRGAIAAVPGEC
jgi:hypothetical protein